MNIVHFASDFYPNLGGVQEFVCQLAHEQLARGHHPIIITNRWPKTLPRTEVYEDIPVYRTVFRVPEQNWRQMTTAAVMFIPTLLKLLRILKKHHAEVFHIQCIGPNAFYALHASRCLNLPVVASLHGEYSVDDSHIFQNSVFAQNLLHTILAEADALTSCSLHALHEVEAFHGKALGQRARVIYNGVRNSEFQFSPPYAHRRPYILAIGRHVRQKGFDILLRAYAAVIQTGQTHYDLILAGNGPEHNALKQLATMLDIREHVHFIGAADRPSTARLFAGCSFFILPSRQEPLGIVNLEAMAAGKPVIASRVDGVPEIIIHERNGILVEPENISALTKAILRLISERDLRIQLGAAGQEQARCYDWSVVAEKFIDIYRETQNACH